MALLSVSLLIIFIICHISIFLFQINALKWDTVRERGMTISLLVWGAYRKPVTHEFVKPEKLKSLVLLDKIRWYSLLLGIGIYAILLILSWI